MIFYILRISSDVKIVPGNRTGNFQNRTGNFHSLLRNSWFCQHVNRGSLLANCQLSSAITEIPVANLYFEISAKIRLSLKMCFRKVHFRNSFMVPRWRPFPGLKRLGLKRHTLLNMERNHHIHAWYIMNRSFMNGMFSPWWTRRCSAGTLNIQCRCWMNKTVFGMEICPWTYRIIHLHSSWVVSRILIVNLRMPDEIQFVENLL